MNSISTFQLFFAAWSLAALYIATVFVLALRLRGLKAAGEVPHDLPDMLKSGEQIQGLRFLLRYDRRLIVDPLASGCMLVARTLFVVLTPLFLILFVGIGVFHWH